MSKSKKTIKLDIYKDKLNKIIKGLWTIQPNQFFIEITFDEKSAPNRAFSRIINQHELRALKTQIQLLLTNTNFKIIKRSIKESHTENIFTNDLEKRKINFSLQKYIEIKLAFLYRYYKIKKYKKILKYFSQQGIDQLEKISRKSFESIANYLEKFNDNFYNNQKSLTFSLPKIHSNTFRIIGNNIQKMDISNNNNNRDFIFADIYPYLNAISGQILNPSTFYQKVSEFLNGILPEILFDPVKLGYCFCNFILKPPNISFQPSKDENKDVINTIPNLKKSIQNAFYTKNLLFFKVAHPAHCYHCIKSLSKLLAVNNRQCIIYFSEKTLIFCKNDGSFAEQIKQIPKSSVKDSDGSNISSVYFIVHPETLNDEDYSLLEEFINTRIFYVNDTDLSKVIIITTSNFEKSFSFFSNDIKFEINDQEEIEAFYRLSLDEKNQPYKYYLYKSEFPGSGKTHKIHERIKKIQIQENFSENPKSVFIDSNMKYLPELKYTSITHFDLSPELFDEKFGFFDDLWIFCNLHYHILPNGQNVSNPKYIFFEAPTLTKNQHPEGGSIKPVDFPIAIPPENIVDVKSSDSEILLSSHVSSICKKVFKLPDDSEAIYTRDLLKISLNMFYPSLFNDDYEPNFDLRIISETNLFLDRFCEDLKLDEENLELTQTLFLLLLKTNFHIWTMNNIFNGKEQSKSFIILAKQSLFKKKSNEKWNLLCFFSKDEKVTEIWETKFLINEISDKIRGISDSTLFSYEFFNKLNKCKELIDVYSNLLDFCDDQTIYFKIISSFFFIDKDKDSFYNNMIDSYMVKIAFDSYKNNKDIMSCITNSINARELVINDFFKSHPERLQSFEIMTEILIRRASEAETPSMLIDLQMTKRDQLEKEKGKKYLIDSMIFTITLVKKFVIMILRIILNQPVILEGFTGVGKTAVVHLLNTLLDIAGDSINWRLHQVDCHGDLLFNNIQEDVINKNLNNSSDSDGKNQIFFFDELNTSPGSCCVINYMNNYNMIQRLKNDDDRKITFIAAINPYVEVDKTTRDLSRVGIKQIIPTKICKLKLCKIAPEDRNDYYETPDLNKLAYNVRELSESTKTIILKSDPELFLINDNDVDMNTNNERARFLPPDEIKVVKSMILKYYNLLPTIIPENIDITNAIEQLKEHTIRIISNLLCESFVCVRSLMLLRSILSYRDVKRYMMHFLNFFRKQIKYIKKEMNQDEMHEYVRTVAIPKSIIYSLMLSIVLRFSSHTKIDKAEENELKDRCSKINFELLISKEGDNIILNIFLSLLNKLCQIKWDVIPRPDRNWMEIIFEDFSDKIFKKYANKDGIFKLRSLVIHLFAITSCYSVSKHFPNEPIMPCLIIGMPGTSKTLAIQLFTQHKNKKSNFYSTTYLSTRSSEADGLNAHYRDCAMFIIESEIINNKSPMAICVIDELGLANLNETRPLKLLHYYFDKGISMELKNRNDSQLIRVMSIAASNYALDFANMNRGILICTDLPSDEDISNSFPNDKEQANKFLKTLWSLTANKQRPEMLALRPLYLLYNVLFVYNARYFYDICMYLTSIISCHPLEAPEKARTLLNIFKIENVDCVDSNSSDIMCKSIDNVSSSETLARALCCRTKNYDCIDFIEEVIRKATEHRKYNCIFHHIYPNDFKLPTHVCADHALSEIFHMITEDRIAIRERHFFLIIGNASFSDALLDLLNAPFENKGNFDIGSSSLISQNGFSIQIDSIPRHFQLIFIMNDSDFEKKNSIDSFPLPLLDRFDQIYFDYESDMDIIKPHKDFRMNNQKYMIPDCPKIHDYFLHFIDKISDIEMNKKIPIIVVEKSKSDEIINKFVSENHKKSDLFEVYLSKYGTDINFKPGKRVIAIFEKEEKSKKSAIVKETQNNFLKINKPFENYYFENYSRNALYELEDDSDQKIIRDNYFNFNIESFNGSIVSLKDHINKNNSNTNGVHAIIFTISPIMEALKDMNDQNSIILFDQYIGSSLAFEEKINSELNETTEYIIIQSNQFSNNVKNQSKALVHDRHIRYILNKVSKDRPDLNFIIIYHLKDSKLPNDINTSLEWPVFWIESVSDSPIDANDSNKITKCILFKEEYKNNYSELVRNIFEQLYLDLWTNFNILLPAPPELTTSKETRSFKKKKSTDKPKTRKTYTAHPKLEIELKNRIFEQIIKEEKLIAHEIDQNDDFDDSIFKTLFYTLRSNSYMNIDLKRLFYEKLKGYLPSYLSFFIKLLISNTNTLNKQNSNVDSIIEMIHKLYDTGFVQRNFKQYVTNQFQPYSVSENAPYFPELILEQVLILYEQNYTGSIIEVLNYIDQYLAVQSSRSNVIHDYLNHYFIPILNVIKPDEEEKVKKIKIVNDFYAAFETLLLHRGGYASETIYTSFHNHLQEYKLDVSSRMTFQNYLTIKFMNDFIPIRDSSIRNSMQNSNKLTDLFFKYQLLTNIYDSSQNLTSINKDELSSSNLIELTKMAILGRPFMTSDAPFIDLISKTNEELGEHGAESYIFRHKSFINFIYFEKLVKYCQGERKTKFEIKRDDTFFNHHYVFPDDAFSSIDILAEDIPSEDLSIIGDIDTSTLSPQLFKENVIFTRTYDLINSTEFPQFTTSSKSYIQNVTNYLYPHEMIRKHILSKCDYTTESFSEWLFDTDAPLFVRQLYAIFNSIKKQNEEEIAREFIVLSMLLNPWSKDPTVLILFWNYVNNHINNFIPKQTDSATKYSRISKNIERAFENTKWNYSLQEGRLYYIYDHKCIKPIFLYEINYQLDKLIFSVAISSESCGKYLKYANMFKSLPYTHLIREIPLILAFSEYLQKKFIIELDTLFVILSTLNCGELAKIGEGMKGIDIYTEIQHCIETNEELLESNKEILEPNLIKNLLLKINQAFPDKSSYEQINLYTRKIVNFYNTVFSNFYNSETIMFNHVQLSTLMTNFNISDLIVVSSFLISYDNGIENNCTIDIDNFLKTAFSIKTKFSNNERIELKNIFPKIVRLIIYPEDFDFLGFKIGHFSESLFNNFNFEEVVLNTEYFIRLENDDELIKEKALAMTIKCRPYNNLNSGDNFDALAYLLVILSRSREKVPDKKNQYKFLFYDIVNNNRTRMNQVFENLRSLESNVDFQKSRVHIKAQSIIKKVLRELIPVEIQRKYQVLFSNL